jgi:hypothetical protein
MVFDVENLAAQFLAGNNTFPVSVKYQLEKPIMGPFNLPFDDHLSANLRFNSTTACGNSCIHLAPISSNFYNDGSSYTMLRPSTDYLSPGPMIISHWVDGSPVWACRRHVQDTVVSVGSIYLCFTSPESTQLKDWTTSCRKGKGCTVPKATSTVVKRSPTVAKQTVHARVSAKFTPRTFIAKRNFVAEQTFVVNEPVVEETFVVNEPVVEETFTVNEAITEDTFTVDEAVTEKTFTVNEPTAVKENFIAKNFTPTFFAYSPVPKGHIPTNEALYENGGGRELLPPPPENIALMMILVIAIPFIVFLPLLMLAIFVVFALFEAYEMFAAAIWDI